MGGGMGGGGGGDFGGAEQAWHQPQMSMNATPSLPTGQRMFELLMPEVAPVIQMGMGQSVAAALIAAAELMGVANDLRMQLMATMPAGGMAALMGGKGQQQQQ